MKNILKNSVLLFTTFSVFSQNFSLKQLQNFNLLSLSDFKTEINKLGFSHADKTESEMFILHEYTKMEKEHNFQISKFQYKNEAENCIQYATSNKKEFDLFLASIIKTGYKLTETGKKYGEHFSVYKLKSAEIKLYYPDPEIKDDNMKTYIIIVYK